MILVLDTHAEEVFIGLWNPEADTWKSEKVFLGGRELNSLILQRLDSAFTQAKVKPTALEAIVVAAGPGSFTGLRIGISVANTLAYVLDVPIVGPAEAENTEELLQSGLHMLKSAGSQYDLPVVPYYGADPHITKPKG